MLACKKCFRTEGLDTFAGMSISRELDVQREYIRKFIDSCRVKKKYKHIKKKNEEGSVVVVDSSEMTSIQTEIQNEIDDLDKFIQDIVDNENKAKQPVVIKP